MNRYFEYDVMTDDYGWYRLLPHTEHSLTKTTTSTRFGAPTALEPLGAPLVVYQMDGPNPKHKHTHKHTHKQKRPEASTPT